MNLTKEEHASVKSSYFNILALFFENDKVESKYAACLIKWSVQLNLSPKDLHEIESGFDRLPFEEITDKTEKTEAIYHLVHMIYLDHIVEDIELEVASIYAQRLGFQPHIVGELFKSVVTAPFDGVSAGEARKIVKDFLELQDI